MLIMIQSRHRTFPSSQIPFYSPLPVLISIPTPSRHPLFYSTFLKIYHFKILRKWNSFVLAFFNQHKFLESPPNSCIFIAEQHTMLGYTVVCLVIITCWRISVFGFFFQFLIIINNKANIIIHVQLFVWNSLNFFGINAQECECWVHRIA